MPLTRTNTNTHTQTHIHTLTLTHTHTHTHTHIHKIVATPVTEVLVDYFVGEVSSLLAKCLLKIYARTNGLLGYYAMWDEGGSASRRNVHTDISYTLQEPRISSEEQPERN